MVGSNLTRANPESDKKALKALSSKATLHRKVLCHQFEKFLASRKRISPCAIFPRATLRVQTGVVGQEFAEIIFFHLSLRLHA